MCCGQRLRMTKLHEDFARQAVNRLPPKLHSSPPSLSLLFSSFPLPFGVFSFSLLLFSLCSASHIFPIFLVRSNDSTMTRRRTMEMQRQAKMTADASTTICDDGHRCENWSLCVEKEGDEGVSPHSCFVLLGAARTSPCYTPLSIICILMRPLPLDSTCVELLL